METLALVPLESVGGYVVLVIIAAVIFFAFIINS